MRRGPLLLRQLALPRSTSCGSLPGGSLGAPLDFMSGPLAPVPAGNDWRAARPQAASASEVACAADAGRLGADCACAGGGSPIKMTKATTARAGRQRDVFIPAV